MLAALAQMATDQILTGFGKASVVVRWDSRAWSHVLDEDCFLPIVLSRGFFDMEAPAGTFVAGFSGHVGISDEVGDTTVSTAGQGYLYSYWCLTPRAD